MAWWGWVLFGLLTVGGLSLTVLGAHLEAKHIDTQERKRRVRPRGLARALARTSAPTPGVVKMCIGCGSTTEGQHELRIGGRPCPYSFRTSEEYVANTTQEEREEIFREGMKRHGLHQHTDGSWRNY